MSDLEDDLLALAGGDDIESEEEYEPTIGSSKNDQKDGGDEESDDDEILSKKKRRRDSDLGFDDDEEAQDDNDNEAEEEELVNPYPLEGKFKDDEDRENLLAMDEMQREQILFDRTQEMERYNERKYLLQRMKQQKQAQLPSKPTRTSNRNKDTSNKTSKLDKLSELKKQREQKDRKRRRDYDDYDEEEEEDDDDRDDEEVDEYDEYDEDEGPVSWGTSRHRTKRSYQRAQLGDINKIIVGRSKLSKHCYYSDFADTVIDCYGKINLGMDKRTRQPMYRMVKIIDVQNYPQRAYRLGSSKCDIYLNVSQNRKQTKEFPISIFSDSLITPDEFKRYVYELEKADEEIDYVDDVNEKLEQLNHFLTRGVSDKDVNEMIAKKQKLQSQTQQLSNVDAVFQKSKLSDELNIARQQGRFDKVKELQEKINKLETMLIDYNKSHNQTESYIMAKLNERNRKINQTVIRKAELETIKNSSSVTDDSDPFSRLKTNTRTFYQDIVNQENEKALNDVQQNYQELIDEKTKQEEEIAKSTYRVLGEMDKLIKSIDIKIDLQF
jgi:RNA polymerase-associated protein RTF1